MSDEKRFLTREQELVNAIQSWTASPYIGDDCAVVGGDVLLTTDTLVEDTHFLLSKMSLRDLGWKSIAVNLSDVAAMAGRPKHLLTSVTVPSHISKNDFKELYEGMIECSKAYGVPIVGGDLTRGAKLVINVAVQGQVHERGCMLRSGAKPGDVVIVTGDFGASRAGLWLLLNQFENLNEYQRARYAHFHPLPRLCESWSLVRRCAGRGALMDASDGLADALVQICRASKVGMDIDLKNVPIDKETRAIALLADANPLDWALYGGEDYELVGCIDETSLQNWVDDNPFKVIGVVTAADEINLKSGENSASQIDLSKCFEQIEF